MLGLTGLAGAALLTTGSFALFSSNSSGVSDTFAAGTVQVKVFDGNDCVGTDWSASPQTLSVNYLLPGSDRSKSFTVQNSGSLDEWVGVLAHVPSGFPLKVEYTVNVYQPDPDDGDVSDPDQNGDIHSNCHTGSKGRGAGGEDKSGTDTLLNTYSVGWFTVSDTTPAKPFELPVGYHAQVTYTYQLDQHLSKKYQSLSDPLRFDVWAVQYQNNIKLDNSGPISWDPQKGN